MQLKFENHGLMPALGPPGVGRRPPCWPRLTPPLCSSNMQKVDPFLADLRRASALLKASIKQFEKSDPPGGVQVSQAHGVGKPTAPQIPWTKGSVKGIAIVGLHSSD